MGVEAPDIFELARKAFDSTLSIFRRHGLETDPGLELRRWDGPLCYYDLNDRRIYVSVPDLSDPVGKLQMLYLRSLFACDSDEELFAFFRLMLPYVITHEMAHHLRHRAGLFGSDLWQEEQIANQMALAVVKPRLSREERQFAQRILPAAIQKLESTFHAKDLAADSYHSMLAGLQATGQVSAAMVEDIELLGRLTEIGGDELLANAEGLTPALRARLGRRSGLIQKITADYTSDYSLYVYYQLGWYFLGLSSRQSEYVEGFARKHLQWAPALLPKVESWTAADDVAIRACHQAAKELETISPAGHRYFYRRYRSGLLEKLRDARLSLPQAEMSTQIRMLLEGWKPSGSDPLGYLAHFVVDPEVQALFPEALAGAAPAPGTADALPTETDRRLYAFLMGTAEDAAAAATFERFELLERSDILQDLPAETLVELAHSLVRVRLEEDEPMVREGDVSEDVYLLARGRMVILAERSGSSPLGHIAPGEVFGEMAFFSGDPRSATVMATTASECFVLPGADLRLLAMARPSVLHHMGAALARRLTEVNARIARRAPTPP